MEESKTYKTRTIRIDVPLNFDTSCTDAELDTFCMAYAEELKSFIQATFKWRDKKIKELQEFEDSERSTNTSSTRGAKAPRG